MDAQIDFGREIYVLGTTRLRFEQIDHHEATKAELMHYPRGFGERSIGLTTSGFVFLARIARVDSYNHDQPTVCVLQVDGDLAPYA